MGREVGGGIRMGKTCEPKAFSFQCMTKFTTNKKNFLKNGQLFEQIPLQLFSIFFAKWKVWNSEMTEDQRS